MKRKLFNLFLILAIPAALDAQNYHWESDINPVLIDGFHRILLTPEITSQLRPDQADIRLFDSKGKERPYLVYKDTAHRGVDRFVSYQIVEKEYREGCCSHIVVKNTLADAIDHIVIEVNNADARRQMTLSGSRDGKQWFAVKDKYESVIFDTYELGSKKTTSLLRFDFPKSEYLFYKFDFDDWRAWWHNYNYPVFVVRAGYIEPTFIPEETIETSVPKLSIKEDLKRKESNIHISFAEGQYVDHLRLTIPRNKNELTDYYRAASLYEIIRKDSLHAEERYIASTILSSLSVNELNLSHSKVKDLVLRISNHDDQPLQVSEIHAFEVKHYLVAELNSAETYLLRYGCDTLQAPVYDLQYFREKVPLAPRIVNVSGPRDIFIVAGKKINKKENGFFDNKAVIWIAIALVGLILAFMTTRMLKDMKK
jgi:hypothetical protein